MSARRVLPLLAAATVLASCARQGFPPGGEEDLRGPRVVATRPDTFAVVEPGGTTIEIEFDERISERPAEGTLGEAVVVSPATGEARVEHTRAGLEVDLLGGFRPGTVYRVTVLPVVEDMFGNTMAEPYELVFSTGPEFREGVIAGAVEDRLTGAPVRARVEARPLGPEGDERPPPYWSRTDSAGIFALRFLPDGRYRLRAWEDLDRDLEPDFQEARAFREVRLVGEDTLLVSLSLLPGDTTPPRLLSVEAAGPRTLHLLFDDPLLPEGPGEEARFRVEGPAGEIPVVGLPTLGEFRARLDSLEAAAAPDSVVVEGVAPDTARAAPDTARARGRAAARAAERIAPRQDPARPHPHVFLLLARMPEPGAELRVTAEGVTNVQGTGGGGGEATFEVPEPPPRELDETDGPTGPSGPTGPDGQDAATPPDGVPHVEPP